ncbi:MAG: bifunctional DNA-binding transcriptional regulator/O6-methylguanine-DNA methyltransferase Ada [Gemmatimonadetes bacterium]|nr:bifunctional DNA-binding transcriptional regulator/O6-methylguanine-DNA methyltransferase Ada [Gemmatimonadota bacterium]
MITSPMRTSVAFDPAWEAVVTRDRAQDGRFVYAVTSTGVYCRPSCPSRRPKPANIRFFGSPDDAAAAGFRPCRRCRPDMVVPDDRVARARALLETDEATAALSALARRVGLSPSHLQRSFKARYGVSPRQYLAARRQSRLREALRSTSSVTRAIYQAGFESNSAGYQAAATSLGMSPGRYARGGAGLAIRYQIVPSPLGPMLIAATERGLCAVFFGTDRPTLVASLRTEFFRAELIDGGSPALEAHTAAVLRIIATGAAEPGLPLDPAGTAFQNQVWSELAKIPPGTTMSYAEVARNIGRPRATRAVASAIASNRLALVIPCHRVVRGNGDIGGYRWGAELKGRLLDAEHHRAR